MKDVFKVLALSLVLFSACENDKQAPHHTPDSPIEPSKQEIQTEPPKSEPSATRVKADKILKLKSFRKLNTIQRCEILISELETIKSISNLSSTQSIKFQCKASQSPQITTVEFHAVDPIQNFDKTFEFEVVSSLDIDFDIFTLSKINSKPNDHVKDLELFSSTFYQEIIHLSAFYSESIVDHLDPETIFKKLLKSACTDGLVFYTENAKIAGTLFLASNSTQCSDAPNFQNISISDIELRTGTLEDLNHMIGTNSFEIKINAQGYPIFSNQFINLYLSRSTTDQRYFHNLIFPNK